MSIKINCMRKPRLKDNDPENYLYIGDDLYNYAFDLHYAATFQCPDIDTCVPPALKAMIRATPKVANSEHYYARAKDALVETMYQSGWCDGGAVWNEFMMQRAFVGRYPVLEFEGNVGDALGDFPASMYFIEVKLTQLGELLLYAAQPQRHVPIPYSLINGHYSHYTNILPHNITEIIDALILLVNNSEATLDDVLEIIKGPDFPFGGEIKISKEELRKIYEEGQGDFVLLPKIESCDDGVLVSQYAPMIDAFGVDDFEPYDFEKKLDGEFVHWGRKLHVKTNTPKEIVERVLDNDILCRKIPADFNLIVCESGYKVKCVGLMEILTGFIKYQLEEYSRRCYHERYTIDVLKKKLIRGWQEIKEKAGDKRRTKITLI